MGLAGGREQKPGLCLQEPVGWIPVSRQHTPPLWDLRDGSTLGSAVEPPRAVCRLQRADGTEERGHRAVNLVVSAWASSAFKKADNALNSKD